MATYRRSLFGPGGGRATQLAPPTATPGRLVWILGLAVLDGSLGLRAALQRPVGDYSDHARSMKRSESWSRSAPIWTASATPAGFSVDGSSGRRAAWTCGGPPRVHGQQPGMFGPNGRDELVSAGIRYDGNGATDAGLRLGRRMAPGPSGPTKQRRRQQVRSSVIDGTRELVSPGGSRRTLPTTTPGPLHGTGTRWPSGRLTRLRRRQHRPGHRMTGSTGGNGSTATTRPRATPPALP